MNSFERIWDTLCLEEPDRIPISVKNLKWMIDAGKKYGKYPLNL